MQARIVGDQKPMAKTDTIGAKKVLGSLISVFRNHGFEGASLSRFTESSGLIKASLYHRFPRGKEQMALAALTEVDRIFATHVLAPIDSKGDPLRRLNLVIERLDDFYDGGTHACLLETLGGAGTPPSVRAHVKNTLNFWIAKFTQLSREAGIPAKEARVRAEGAVAAIEGALVISRAQENNRQFKRSLASLAGRLLNR
jgi:TetR/AcrR family transcriptional repressor of lmrAB and yxaGH operons